MTFNEKARALLSKARVGLCALGRWAADRVTDSAGVVGLGLLGRGLWLEFGESWALMAVGAVLMALAVVSAVRGETDV